jgi:hypothetical protein
MFRLRNKCALAHDLRKRGPGHPCSDLFSHHAIYTHNQFVKSCISFAPLNACANRKDFY